MKVSETLRIKLYCISEKAFYAYIRFLTVDNSNGQTVYRAGYAHTHATIDLGSTLPQMDIYRPTWTASKDLYTM